MTATIKCPICGSETSIKTAKKGSDVGKQFYVCNRYPEFKEKEEYQAQREDLRNRTYIAIG